MTAPALTPTIPSQRRRRRPRPRPVETPAWSCDNCTQVNSGRRRRCVDCGTSHY